MALILFVPFKYNILARKYESTIFRAKVSWFFGAIELIYSKEVGTRSKFWLKLSAFKINIKNKKPQKIKAKKDAEKKERNSARFLNKDFIACMIKAFLELINHIKPNKFRLEGRFGFEDPYYTGIALASYNILYPHLKKYDINTCAVFDEDVLEGVLSINGRLIVARVLIIALKTYFNRNVRTILKSKEEKEYVI